jgi:hypothetical protein
MKAIKNLIQNLKSISVVDRFLIAIMFILLIQSVFSFFHSENISSQANTVDVIVRTSSASIFGYFLSENFMKGKKNYSDSKNKTIVTLSSLNDIQLSDENDDLSCNRTQVFIIASICIICLIILLVIRNFFEIQDNNSVSISQLRDFVSSGIGFLVGCGKNS